MSILSFAIGALFAAAGFLSIYYGYGIIEVERGWTSVIAGTVAVAGGLIVMMLALVLHALKDLRRTAAVVGVTPVATPAVSGFAPPVPIPAVPLSPEPDFHLVPAMEAATRNVEALFVEPDPIEPHEPPYSGEYEPLHPHEHEVHVPEHHELPAASAPTSAPADAWFDIDKELALIEQEEASFAPETAPTTLEPMHAAHAEMPPAPEADLFAFPEPLPETHAHVEAPEPVQAAAVDEREPPAVIGRYQADGTAYVMYADGSIETSGPDGDHRFGSMAELKAFIEAKV